jgi:integrase
VPRKSEGLRIVRRADTGSLRIEGTVAGERIRQRAQSNNPRLAKEEAAALEADLLRSQWHGPRRGARPFAEAVKLYLDAEDRSPGTGRRLQLILEAMGDIKLGQIDQQLVNRIAKRILPSDAAPATKKRGIITPLRAVLNLAHKEGWCDPPHFVIPKEREGRTNYLLPVDAVPLLASCGHSMRMLVELVLGTGARMAEALELDWRDVDLVGARASFWRTKGGKPRHAYLPPGLVAALANLPHRKGAVIRRPDGQPYADRDRQGGGQMKHAWRLTKARAIRMGAGIDPDLTQHDLRHTWASWHYALYRDPLKLKLEGGWASLDQVERYVHLMPAGHEAAIEAFWGGDRYCHGAATEDRREIVSA